ncbi:MAG: multiple sugar transport system ATP-binding protein [Gaiellaceae bacterium]|nr:multiple sugar transport system ATP-binding protein [Gaiellaceae bacterium]
MATIACEHDTKRCDDGTIADDDLTRSVGEGEFLILVGPSGCGKTTALRMIAGLEQVSDGEIRIGDKVVNDVPPGGRDIAMVFQNYALYPHMTIRQNISFPLKQAHLPKPEIDDRVSSAARLLGIEELLERKPKELSGGQRQRVAMGRAIVRRPQAFLMDEPLSNLDAKLRVQMRAELIDLHRRLGVTTIYVTHDQTEAMTLGDRVVVLDKGVVQQVDAPEKLYREPANTFVASFIGSPAMNFFDARLDGGVLQLGPWAIDLPATLRSAVGSRSGEVLVGLRPEDFAPVNGSGPSPRIAAEIEIAEQLGPEQLVHFHADGLSVARPEALRRAAEHEDATARGDTVIARFPPNATVAPGQTIEMQLDPQRLQLFDPATGESLLPR